MVDVTAKERVNFFVLLRHAAMLPTTKAGIETIGRPAALCLYQFLPPSFLSVSSFILIYCLSPTLCMCVCVCSPISCHPYLLGDKLHHALSRLCILQRIRWLLTQCFGCALYDRFCRMNIRESTLVAAELSEKGEALCLLYWESLE